ncbi:hypothetical protein AB205_0010440 [Aquarana catesbeiana]|uniref:Uncharacterized protein n=1 Tax=Aquarana catesbeiana TaxID=8400 RepID=A0A2G9RRH6_AQUCT|nr:hypothetical protein AB205_0010440 [Aquarana catesbeiana]
MLSQLVMACSQTGSDKISLLPVSYITQRGKQHNFLSSCPRKQMLPVVSLLLTGLLNSP